MDYEQVLVEVMQYTGYCKNIQNAFYMNKAIHKETEIARKKRLANHRPRKLTNVDYEEEVVRHWYPNGQLEFRAEFCRGYLYAYNGKYQKWYPDGKLLEVRQYKNEERHGLCITYYRNGNKKEVTPYVNGLMHGTRIFYRLDGTVVETVQYYMGNIHGQHIQRNPNGSISSIRGYRMGNAEGEWITNYPNGKVCLQRTYNDNRLNGNYMHWYPNGVLKEEGAFLEGERHGEQFEYTQTGKLLHYSVYSHGRWVEGDDEIVDDEPSVDSDSDSEVINHILIEDLAYENYAELRNYD